MNRDICTRDQREQGPHRPVRGKKTGGWTQPNNGSGKSSSPNHGRERGKKRRCPCPEGEAKTKVGGRNCGQRNTLPASVSK